MNYKRKWFIQMKKNIMQHLAFMLISIKMVQSSMKLSCRIIHPNSIIIIVLSRSKAVAVNVVFIAGMIWTRVCIIIHSHGMKTFAIIS